AAGSVIVGVPPVTMIAWPNEDALSVVLELTPVVVVTPCSQLLTKAVVESRVLPSGKAAVGAVGVPVSAGLAANTSAPVPVSSLITLASCADVVAANWFRPPDVSAMLPAHVKPAPDAQRNALFAPLQLGIANAIGAAVDA
ncbi:hypothetical protein, partial [Burkholderia cenocepacia]|uniref:hypothetical protein n=1 Tax=Burkholderia cenocepacia TaxID=95486 RepID=UPI00222FF10A